MRTLASLLLTAALALALVSVAHGQEPSGPGVRTLVVSPTHINAFAQDGPFLAWIARTPNTQGPRCGRTFIRSLATGARRSFGTQSAPVCGGRLVLGRDRALWTADPGVCGACTQDAVYTAALSDPRVVRLGIFIYRVDGDQVAGLAADWNLLAFSWVRFGLANDCLGQPIPCIWERGVGRVTRVVGHRKEPVPGVMPAAELAAAGGRIAVAPVADMWEGDRTPAPAAENGPVEIRNAVTGALVMSVSPAGTVRALALSATELAALIEAADGTLRIDRFAVPAGTLLASTAVNERTAHEIDMAGKWIVYRVSRKIRLIGPLGGSRLLIHTQNTPINVSIEGRRVAWAENGVELHRIRAVLAPR